MHTLINTGFDHNSAVAICQNSLFMAQVFVHAVKKFRGTDRVFSLGERSYCYLNGFTMETYSKGRQVSKIEVSVWSRDCLPVEF